MPTKTPTPSPDLAVLADSQHALSRLADQERTLRRAYAAALAARRAVAGAPPPADDVVTSMRALVAAHAARWAAEHAPTIIEWCGGSYRASSADATILRRQRPRLWRPPGALHFDDVVGLFPDLAADRLEAIIRSHPYAAGAALDERPAALAAADAALAAAEDAHTALVDEAAQYGVTLPLLDVVRQRRETARIRGEMDAAAARQRAALEAAIEQQAASTPRAVRSAYLASDGATMRPARPEV